MIKHYSLSGLVLFLLGILFCCSLDTMIPSVHAHREGHEHHENHDAESATCTMHEASAIAPQVELPAEHTVRTDCFLSYTLDTYYNVAHYSDDAPQRYYSVDPPWAARQNYQMIKTVRMLL